MPEWTHRVNIRRPIPSEGEGAVLKIEAGLHHLSGNKTPYFSVTAELRVPYQGGAFGQLNEQVLEVAPELKPVVDLHLSDHRGYPMHCIANGLYHLGFGRWSELKLEHVASHFRITYHQAAELRAQLLCGGGYIRKRYAQFIREQRPRWKREAREARELLDSLKGTI